MTAHTTQDPQLHPDSNAGPRLSNWFATLVLVPTVPMLLASVAALAFFYLAPVRFGAILSRLPGESFLRTALVFAPATLFAVVVLAYLYAVDRPETAASDDAGAVEMQPGRGRLAASIALVPVIPGLLLSSALWALSFVSPARLERLIEPLPGTTYIRRLIPLAPPLLFLAAFILLAYLFLSRPRDAVRPATRKRGVQQFTNVSVFATLGFAVLAFAFAVAALATYHFKPDTFAALIAHIPMDEIVRTLMMFSPAVLFALVVLALLYLLKDDHRHAEDEGVDEIAAAGVSLRGNAATLVLVAGLSFSAVAAVGVLGTLIYMLLR